MIRHLRHRQIDKAAWDAVVRQSRMEVPYALSWWLDILSPGWEGIVAEERWVFPLPVKRKMGVKIMLQPPFIQQLGIFSMEKMPPAAVAAVVAALPRSILYGDIQLNELTPTRGWPGQVTLRRNILLHLDGKASQRYHTNTRRNLKKFLATGAEIREEADGEREMVRLFAREARQKTPHLRREHYERLLRLYQQMRERGMLRLFVARRKEELMGMAAFIDWRGRWIFHFSAATAAGRQSHVLTGILDHFIRSEEGCGKVLDFEGAEAEGLARFYLGFGGREVWYPHWTFSRVPLLPRRS